MIHAQFLEGGDYFLFSKSNFCPYNYSILVKSLKIGDGAIYFDVFSGTLDFNIDPKMGKIAPILWPFNLKWKDPTYLVTVKSADRLIIFDESGDEIFNELLVTKRKGAAFLRHKFTFVPFLEFEMERIWFTSFENNLQATIRRCKSV